MDKVRLGFLGPTASPIGGIETFHTLLLKTLDRSRIEVVGMGVRHPRSCEETLAGYRALGCPAGIGPVAMEEVAHQADVLFCWGLADLWPYVPAHPPKVVMMSQVSDDSDWATKAHRAVDPQVDRWVVVSRAGLRSIPEHRRDSAVLIPNALEPSRIAQDRSRDEVRHEWCLEAGDLVAGFLGRLAHEKVSEGLVRAVEFLGPWWHLVVCGDGTLRKSLEAESRRLLGPRGHFLGSRRDTANVLGGFDVLCCPSRTEGCSFTVLESMALGVPVVSTPTGLLEEHPELAAIVPHGSTSMAWARAIKNQVLDTEGTMSRVEAARTYVMAHHSAESFGRSWSDLLCAQGS